MKVMPSRSPPSPMHSSPPTVIACRTCRAIQSAGGQRDRAQLRRFPRGCASSRCGIGCLHGRSVGGLHDEIPLHVILLGQEIAREVDAHHPAPVGQRPDLRVGQVTRAGAERPAIGVAGDERPAGDGAHLVERGIGEMRDVHHHMQRFGQLDELDTFRGQRPTGAGGGARPRKHVVAPRRDQVAHAGPMEMRRFSASSPSGSAPSMPSSAYEPPIAPDMPLRTSPPSDQPHPAVRRVDPTLDRRRGS